MPGVAAVIGGAATLWGASEATKAGKKAAKKQAQIARDAMSEEQRRFEAGFAAGEPFRAAGEEALAKLSGGFDVTGTDIFKQRLEAEQKSLGARLSSTGQLRGGRGLRATSDLTRSLTAEETQRQFGDLLRIAQLGLSAGVPGGGVNTGAAIGAAGARGEAGQIMPSVIQQFGEQLPGFMLRAKKAGLFDRN